MVNDACPSRICCGVVVGLRVVDSSSNRLRSIFFVCTNTPICEDPVLFMISFLSRTIDFFFFFLSLWIYLWLAETSQQPISQTTWLKVTPHCNHYTILINVWGVFSLRSIRFLFLPSSVPCFIISFWVLVLPASLTAMMVRLKITTGQNTPVSTPNQNNSCSQLSKKFAHASPDDIKC